jgi:replicative DNA helicase
MVNTALFRRLVAQDARVSATHLKTGRLSPVELDQVEASLGRLRALPVWLSDEAVSLTEVTRLVTADSYEPNLGLVIIDYLQLIRAPSEIRERRLQVEHVSQVLKTLAVSARLPVLCLSSLSRPIKGKPTTPPTLADLRESGELEHDADIVLFLHRPKGQTETECLVAKNRDGRTGSMTLLFRPDYVAFDEPSERTDPGA